MTERARKRGFIRTGMEPRFLFLRGFKISSNPRRDTRRGGFESLYQHITLIGKYDYSI